MMSALLTPFDAEGNVNFTVLAELVEWQLAHGLAGFYILGSSGEGLLMSEAERRSVAEAAVVPAGQGPRAGRGGRGPRRSHAGGVCACQPCGQIRADRDEFHPALYYNVGPEGVKQYYIQSRRPPAFPSTSTTSPAPPG